MTDAPAPPAWAETVLTLFLRPSERDSVSGDLLEAYRDTVLPRRGPVAADLWYCRQVASFAWRVLRVWIVLLSSAVIGRTALDWLVPTHDFSVRATVTTLASVGLFVSAGLWAAWRSSSVGAAVAAGLVTSAATAAISIPGTLVLLAIWHDPRTIAAIDGSGGLAEALTMHIAIVLPATILATLGGVAGKGLARITASR